MKSFFRAIAAILSFAALASLPAATLYVDLNSPSPTPPYASWTTAATNIQEAIEAATDGDLVLVTNGVYATGGKVMFGDLTNRVALDKAITVQSVNGWTVTVIEGRRDFVNASATNAIRCVWMTNGAVLSGFTLREGQTRSAGDADTLRCGGGVWCATTNAVITNSVIRGSAAALFGGGSYRGTLKNCWLDGNSAGSGGGAAGSILINSALIANFAHSQGGGAYQAALTNCTVSKNSASLNSGATHSTHLHNSIVWGNVSPAPIITPIVGSPPSYSCLQNTTGGTGNLYVDPQLTADGFHLAATSPCRTAGNSAYASGVDLDGQGWDAPPAMGCDQWRAEPTAGMAEIKPVGGGGVELNIAPAGQQPIACWWLKDGIMLADGARYSGVTSTNLRVANFGPSDAGYFQTVVSNAFGMTTSLVARVTVRCVDAAAVVPVWPHLDWATAAPSIQAAIEASSAGDFIVVTNGVYASGGKVMSDDLTNRVALDRPVTVLSVNGPNVTFIEGQKDSAATNGPAAIRAVWLSDGARLDGFTVRNGATRATGNQAHLLSGGGVWASSTNALVANCTVISNAAQYGGGAYRATLERCTLKGNWAQMDGGGSYSNLINGCLISENRASANGGGTWGAWIYNSAITKNIASFAGGGIYGAMARNCTVTFNRANVAGGIYPGSGSMSFTNLIVWANEAGSLPNYNSSAVFHHSCSTPLPIGTANIVNDPLLVDDGIHLATNSPCRGTGALVATGLDIDGQAWSNPPSRGCDEWGPSLVVTAPKFYSDTWGQIRVSATVLGQEPITVWWLKNGIGLTDSGNLSGAATANLVIHAPTSGDVAGYQLVASNALGVVTGLVNQLTLRFVDVNAVGSTPPYLTWGTAATNIQDAVTEAQPGDVIVVANGIYGQGGRAMAENLTNRVVLDKPVTLMSANGPSATIIQGAWDFAATNGPGAVRGVWLADGAALVGFTIRGGATRTGGTILNNSGGGIWCNSTNARVVGCIIEHCAAAASAAVSRGTIINSLIRNNVGFFGVGGVSAGTIINCTVTQNKGSHATGGIETCKVFNSIIWDNRAFVSGPFLEYTGSSITNSCTAPLPAGGGNISADPRFDGDGFHLQAGSPCLEAGSSNFVLGFDLDGQPWSTAPSMGCDERLLRLAVGQPAIVPTGDGKIRLRVAPVGAGPVACWWFKDGALLADDGRISGALSPELAISSFHPADAGYYQAVVTNSYGSVTSAVVLVRPHFVDLSSLTPTPPYANWASAATTIQAAIDVANHGDLIVVADGIHAGGGRTVSGDLTNRVVLTKAVLLSSLNGPGNAFIEGAKDIAGPNGNGNGAVRPVWMESWTSLAGFTIRNGATRTNGDVGTLQSGGGIWGLSAAAMVRGSLVTNNVAQQNGGGVWGCSVENSLLAKNQASSGGGIFGGSVVASRLIENQALNAVGHGGGGAHGTMLRNSLIHQNSTVNPSLGGGGTYNCAVYNCTVTENVGNGLNWGSAYNTIFWGNTPRNYSGSPSINYSLAAPGDFNYGTNNLFTEPLLVDALHLTAASPARNAGGPLFVSGTDLDGEAWSSPASIGADEFNSASISGPLLVALELSTNHILQNREVGLTGRVTGRAARIEWNFGTGNWATNRSYLTSYAWSNPGNYPVTFTAYNDSNPGGVSASAVIQVLPVIPPLLTSIQRLTGYNLNTPFTYYEFSFSTQLGVSNVIEFATNLAAPVVWMPLKTSVATNLTMTATDIAPTNAARFYRLNAQ